MIDPTKVTNFQRNPKQLEEFFLFCVAVAGKGAFQQAKKLDAFLSPFLKYGYTPFGVIRTLDMDGTLEKFLQEAKIGQYDRIASAYRAAAHFFHYDDDNDRYHPLSQVHIKYLECIRGVGMKTARFFVMHSRPNQPLACLDTHILAWLRDKGHNAPKSTPNGKKYLELEKIFLEYARSRSMSPADLDLQIWNEAHGVKTKISS